ncbi:hypothetical protein O181_115979 [Austropuccinia psidii MF-1]|uniref:Uncharacterized protein n=1 Tax=Austropuccinia psidii MF-1 TaxID=1389203 RepID=A0A9Q3KAM1_9BASI|nr:hypothetical protein [Austropuccinia psidii MF-1]
MGIVALSCLSLPPSICHKLPHLFLSGIMPGPQVANMTPISHPLMPLVDDLLHFKDPVEIPTFQRPNGRMIQVCLLKIVRDSGATHKVGGFASHSATYFCTWFLMTDRKISKLKCGQQREGRRVENS